MSSLLTLFEAPASAAWDGDPADLTPAEWYNETTWFWEGEPDWRELTGGANQAFDTMTGAAAITPTSKNSLTCYESAAAGSLHSLSATRNFSEWLTTDPWITIYIVARWDGGADDTLLWFDGAQANELWRVKVSSSNQFYTQVRATNSESLIISPGVDSTSSGWHVWAIRIHNITGAGVIDWFQEQETPVNVTNASWVAMGIGVQTNINRIFSNNSLTEKWDGALAELILFKEEHTDAQVQAINSFLATKWGIT
jgi:hypothetical protein